MVLVNFSQRTSDASDANKKVEKFWTIYAPFKAATIETLTADL